MPVLVALLLIAAVVALLGLWRTWHAPVPTAVVATAPKASSSVAPQPIEASAHYVGRAACATCHAEEDKLWRGSHHDLAMQEATASTVLGDFADKTFTYHDITSRFFRRDGKFIVTTDGPDGKLADYPIKYTFGVWPLQQYLIEFPGGRLQTLVHRLGCADEGGGWSALVSSLSE